ASRRRAPPPDSAPSTSSARRPAAHVPRAPTTASAAATASRGRATRSPASAAAPSPELVCTKCEPRCTSCIPPAPDNGAKSCEIKRFQWACSVLSEQATTTMNNINLHDLCAVTGGAPPEPAPVPMTPDQRRMVNTASEYGMQLPTAYDDSYFY